jgi:hypothetical protein
MYGHMVRKGVKLEAHRWRVSAGGIGTYNAKNGPGHGLGGYLPAPVALS